MLFGADRAAANGDVANKIGSYNIAVLAKEHGIPCYSVVPTSTIDLSLAHGDLIPIEERGWDEVAKVGAEQIAPDGVPVYNPAFDVTPHRYLTGIITEEGVCYPPYRGQPAPRGRGRRGAEEQRGRGRVMRFDLRPFDAGMIAEAGRLLAQRHRRDRMAMPTLPARFEDPEVAAQAVDADLGTALQQRLRGVRRRRHDRLPVRRLRGRRAARTARMDAAAGPCAR